MAFGDHLSTHFRVSKLDVKMHS